MKGEPVTQALDQVASDPEAGPEDFRRILERQLETLSPEAARQSLGAVGIILYRWVDSILARFPLQATPISKDFGVTNRHLASDADRFHETAGEYAMMTFELLVGTVSWDLLSPDDVDENLTGRIQDEIVDAYCRFVDKVEKGLEASESIEMSDDYDAIWFFAFYLRLSRVLAYELTGFLSTCDLNGITQFVRRVLPMVRLEHPIAVAACLSFLTELVACAPHAVQLMHGTLKTRSETLDEKLEEVAWRGLLAEGVLWARVGMPSRTAETFACLAWLHFVTYTNSPESFEQRRQILDRGWDLVDFPDLENAAPRCPFLTLETIRYIFVVRETEWLPISTGNVFQDIMAGTYGLDRLLVDPTAIPSQTLYRSVLKAEFLARPPLDVLASWLISSRSPGEAALTLVTFGTRLDQPLLGGGLEFSHEARRLAEAREHVNRTWREAARAAEEAACSGVAVSPHQQAEHQHAREEFLSVIARELRSTGASMGSMKQYREHCRGRFEILERQAKLYGIELLFLGLADQGYLFVHFNGLTSKIVGGQFFQQETRTSLMEDLTLSFAHDDDEAVCAKAEFVAGTIVGSFALGSRLCIIPIGVLSALPLAPAFSQHLEEDSGRNGAVAQLSEHFFLSRRPETEGVDPREQSYVGFADLSGLENTGREFHWESLGLTGEVESRLSRRGILQAMATGHRVVHVATHGVFDAATPMFSGWVTDDGLVTGWDLASGDFHTDLLVVNACSGTRGGVFASSSGFGPVQLALGRGVTSALSPSAPVDDEAAATLLTDFQSGLKGGCSLAEAYHGMITAAASRGRDPDWMYYTLQGVSIPALFDRNWAAQ